jgi:plastocyanin
MRRISGIVIALTLVAFGAVADEQSEHLEHLKAMIAALSEHGPVVPQPDAISEQATKTIDITARSFSFTPASFSVNQGDVVTVNINVPSNDASSIGHGFLMDTYFQQGVNVGRGQTKTVIFTATTPGTFAWVCTQPSCGSGHSNMFGQMVVNAVSTPTITNVSPSSGTTAGGTAVTISGTSFSTSGTTTVTFGGSAAANVTVTGATSITVTTPAHAAGTVDVVVNTGGGSATASSAFTYITPGPKLTSITPNTGSTAGGTVITIIGSGFVNGATVTIGGLPATEVNVGSSTSITAKTPVGPATQQAGQPRDVVVTNPDGLSDTLTQAFTYFVPPLSIATISPAVGGTLGGSVVTITGTGFTTGVNSSVTFGGVAAPNVTIVDAITLQATTPPHAVGTVDIVVTFGTSVTKPSAFTYQTIPPRHRATKH